VNGNPPTVHMWVFSFTTILASRCASYAIMKSTINLRKDTRSSTRWFIEHAIVNYIISMISFPHIIHAVEDVNKVLDSNHHGDTRRPLCLAVLLHVYHALFFGLSAQDILHHVIFVSLLAIPGLAWQWGVLGSCQCFFICGLPGAIIYTLLAFRRLGYMCSVNEPMVSYIMNMLVRAPGILLCTITFLYTAWRGNPLPNAPMFAWGLQILLSPINAIYYAHQSRRRLYRKDTRQFDSRKE
jgi:hypothetical protein